MYLSVTDIVFRKKKGVIMTRPSQDISYPKYLFRQGKSSRAYELFGAHPARRGYRFRVWAPHARAVAVAGDFNNWDPDQTPMRQLEDDPEIWECVCEEASCGDCYKYAITTADGRLIYKADPYGFSAEPPQEKEIRQMASRLTSLDTGHLWTDQSYLKRRASMNPYTSPMNIYEVHLGSWQRHDDGSYYSYRETADALIPYVKDMGFTHMELLPVMEYPYDGSWGYQSTGYFSVTSRFGEPEDFVYFVNKAHENGIGVILDWVPAHFPKDAYGLIDFDGDFLYEDSDPLRREHKEWGTRAFDFGRNEVRSFLLSSAAFWCDVYHADGIRVDAVSAMLYLDYCRQDGEWRPNKDGGKENLEAISFLKLLNESILTEFPGVLMIAEESTAWPLITMPPSVGGLGFNFKWNMGWMNDTLEYFQTDPLFRRGVHNKLTFSITYAWSENYILPISHDEVVHGKHSLLDKMPGDYDSKFAGARVFFTYMMTHPGKKLLFMGSEFGQFIEWNEKQKLDWLLLDYDQHRRLKEYLRELNQLYLQKRALWSMDNSWDGFRWIDADDGDRNIFSYYRIGDDGRVCLCILNLSGNLWTNAEIGVPAADHYELLLDSDLKRFGGSGKRRRKKYRVIRGERNGFPQHLKLNLPPLSAILLENAEG